MRLVACGLLVAFCASSLFASSLCAQGKVDPAVRARLDRQFAEAHPQPGDYLPSLRLQTLSRQPDAFRESILHAKYGDVKLIVTASLTCPKTRQHLPAIQQLKKKYGQQLGVTIVYVIEAHPETDVCPYLGVVDVTEANLRDNIRYRQPTTMEGRVKLAERFSAQYPLDATILIDSMDNVAWRALGQSPNLALLATSEGRVVLRQGWVDPATLEPEIDKHIAAENRERQEQERRWERPEPSDQLKEIMKRLQPEYPNTWEFVRWLEKVDLPRLRLLFKKYPNVINEVLVYGAHGNRQATILQLMIERKDLALVKETIAAGGDVNRAAGWSSPLTTAASAHNLEILDELIKSGADVHRNPDPQTRSVLHAALMEGHHETARRLIQAGAPQDIFSFCGLGMLDEVRQELDRNPSSGLRYDVAGNIPLSYAVAGQQTAIVDLLLTRGMTADAGGHHNLSPVELAAQLDSPDILRLLMKHGDSPMSSAAFIAIEKRNFESFKILLDAKAAHDGKLRGETLLHRAARLDLPVEFAKELLDHGADVQALTTGYSDDGCGPEDPKSTQETPLHLAARTLKPQHVALLLSRGAKPDLKDQAGLTPLAAAIAAYLASSYRGDDKESLQEASKLSDGLATIEALIAGGCRTDATDSRGAVIRDALAKLPQHSPQAQPEREPNDGPPFILKPTQYRGPTGFDANQVRNGHAVANILSLLRQK